MANCFAYEFPTYLPAMRIITSITQTDPVVITTSFDHDFVDGAIVRISVPSGKYSWGMNQINKAQGVVTVISPTQFSLPINATGFDPLAQPNPLATPNLDKQCPYVVPVGEINSSLKSAVRNVL